MRSRVGLLVVGVILAGAGAVRAAKPPVAVSPGSADGMVQVELRCPTFNWAGVPGAKSYELVVYLVGEHGEEVEPVLRRTVPGTANGWTPSLDRGLERGQQYAWSVRAIGKKGRSAWSSPSLFQVAAGPSEAEFAAGRAGLTGDGPDEKAGVGSIDASVKTARAGGITEEDDEKAVEVLLATRGPGGSNTGLDAAYDAGRIITLDDGQIELLGVNDVNIESLDGDVMIRDGIGGNPEFRLQVDGASPLQVWRFGLDAITGRFEFVNTTAGSTVPFKVTKTATDNLLTLDGSAVKISDELQVGGADLSENFDVSGGFGLAAPEPGMVVSIGPLSPGRLTVSGTPYDRMVAGVVSGAGGIESGLIMGQRGSVADGAFPVALTGRVYVWVDAAYGAVSPGDLLTTSATAGHAMKVSDYGQAQGAILGKAMTGLSEGQDLVLMLISLQ